MYLVLVVQTKLVDLSLLSIEEIEWLNNYHSQVWEKVCVLMHKYGRLCLFSFLISNYDSCRFHHCWKALLVNGFGTTHDPLPSCDYQIYLFLIRNSCLFVSYNTITPCTYLDVFLGWFPELLLSECRSIKN